MTSLDYLPRLDHSLSGEDVHPHLGAVLLKTKMLTPKQLDDALAEQVGSNRRLGEILVERGWLFPHDIARALAIQMGFEYVDIQCLSLDPNAARRFDPELGQRCLAIGVRFLTDGTLLIAVADPTSAHVEEIRRAAGCPVAFAVSDREDIENAWRQLLRGSRP